MFPSQTTAAELATLTNGKNERKNVTDKDLLQIQQMRKGCEVSILAAIGDPKHNKNYRNNPSLLISHQNKDDGDNYENVDNSTLTQPIRNVIIDVGKTFREGSLRWMPTNAIHGIDAVVLTHEHADAIGGLDDLRGFQKRKILHGKDNGTSYSSTAIPIPIFLSQQCYKAIEQQFTYLVPKKQTSKASDEVVRYVASLEYNIIQSFTPFVAAGLKIHPLPVLHGEDLISLGFAFSIRGNGNKKEVDVNNKDNKILTTNITNVVYLSDISRMPKETENYILQKLPHPIDILIIDSLSWKKPHSTHVCLEDALKIARIFKPKRVIVVGMGCDNFPPHDEMNDILQKSTFDNFDVCLAHDGLVIEF